MSMDNFFDEDEEQTQEKEEDEFLSDVSVDDIDDGFLDDDKNESDDEGLDVDTEQTLDTDEDVTTSFNENIDFCPKVYYTSSEDMSQVESNSVHLIVTSPPYNADWAYGSHDDSMNYQKEYFCMLARVFKECYRVLAPGGRLMVNTPTLLRGGSKGGQAILSDIDTMLNSKVTMWDVSDDEEYAPIKSCMENTDFKHREWIIWNKGFNDAGKAPNGSFPRPFGVMFNNVHEGISVYQKPGDRSYDDMSDERIEKSKINKWTDELLDDVWNISPEDWDAKWEEDEDVPPFPEELVRRAIAVYTYKGDTVLEPFTGRGTTLKIAKNMQRYSIGYEIREQLKEEIEHYVGIDQAGLDSW